MADEPTTNNAQPSPAPEVLKPQTPDSASANSAQPAGQPQAPRRLRRGSSRPSHRATFIGLIVVVLILAINAAIVGFALKSQSPANSKANQPQVSINESALSKLGVNSASVGDSGVQLTVNPDAKFSGNVDISGNVSIGGQLKLNSELNAGDATFNKLQAGNTTLGQLNVNGDGTLSNLNLRKNLTVAGTSLLQGPVTIDSFLRINNGLSVLGNLSVGGTLAIASFQTTNITIGGHVITTGPSPSASRGPAVGPSGQASISGNDSSGTVFISAGVGSTSGIAAFITFHSSFSNTPHVVVTPSSGLGNGITYYVTRSNAGFSIGVYGSLSPGGYTFDYIVEQ